MSIQPVLFAALCFLALNACSTPAKKPSRSESAVKNAPLLQAEAGIEHGLEKSEDQQAYLEAVREVVASWQNQNQNQSQDPTAKPNFIIQEGATTWQVEVSWAPSLRFDTLNPAVPEKKQATHSTGAA